MGRVASDRSDDNPVQQTGEEVHSPFTHQAATGVDVRMVDWKMWNKVYILPLPAMIGWVLLKFAKFKGEVLLITCLPPSSIL